MLKDLIDKEFRSENHPFQKVFFVVKKKTRGLFELKKKTSSPPPQ